MLKHSIKEHNFINSYIRSWNYYRIAKLAGENGLIIYGTFSEHETSEYNFFSLVFNNICEGAEILSGIDFTGGTILCIEALENGEESDVNLVVFTDKEYTINFRCGKDYRLSLLRYLGFSYKNVYGTKKYNEEVAVYNYVLDDKYFTGLQTHNLPDGFSLEVKSYCHMEKGRKFAALEKCELKKNCNTVYQYTSRYNHAKVFSDFIYHRNGHRYYPFHVDLYGISYIDVDILDVFHYVPQGYDNDYCAVCGESFIVTDIHYDKETNMVAYGGCYWGSTNDVMVGDFSQPLNFDPRLVSIRKIVDPEYEECDDISFAAWDNGILVVKVDYAGRQTLISTEQLIMERQV